MKSKFITDLKNKSKLSVGALISNDSIDIADATSSVDRGFSPLAPMGKIRYQSDLTMAPKSSLLTAGPLIGEKNQDIFDFAAGRVRLPTRIEGIEGQGDLTTTINEGHLQANSEKITNPNNDESKDFFGHGSNLYSLMMCLQFSAGSLLPVNALYKMGIPVPHGEQNCPDDAEYVSVVNYRNGFSTSLNREYANGSPRKNIEDLINSSRMKIKAAEEALQDKPDLDGLGAEDAEEEIKIYNECKIFQTKNLNFHKMKLDFQRNFKVVVDSDPDQKLLQETLSQIPVVMFGSSKNKEFIIEGRRKELGLVNNMDIKFVTCKKGDKAGVEKLVKIFNSNVFVYE